MKELFGLPTSTLAIALTALFAVAMLTVLGVFLSNRMMFKMGLRNIPRRGAQTALVVIGLMLSTLIVTASFTTGDTIDYSISKQTYDLYGRSDLNVAVGATSKSDAFGVPQVQPYISDSLAAALATQFQGDADVAGVLPFLVEQVAVRDDSTGRAEPAVVLNGIDTATLNSLGGLQLTSGSQADLTGLADNQALLSQRAAKRLDAKAGDTLTFFVNGQERQITVAGVVKDSLASGVRGFGSPEVLPGIAMPLQAVQNLTAHAGQINMLTLALRGTANTGYALSDAAAPRVQAFLDSPAATSIVGSAPLTVEKSKQLAVDDAHLKANVFTTLFLILGLFSVAAGIMLIFLIFVMLAGERKAEMGMARAVGAQRRNLIQSFVSEGVAYSIMAGAVGAALGVGAAVALVVGIMRLAGGDSFSFVTAHVTATSLVIGYTLGVVITFVTVVIASLRVSHLNIVAAIRGIDEEREQETRRKLSWKWLAISVPSMLIPPLGLWFLLRKGLGIAKVWIFAPAGVAIGALCIMQGKSTETLFLFSLGMSVIPLSLAGIARRFGAPNRLTWSIVGLYLSAYWMMPTNLHDKLFGKLDGNIEMFVLSGIMIVTGFTLIIVFNARLLTSIVERSGNAAARYRATLALGVLTAALAAAGVVVGNRGDGLGSIFYLVAALAAVALLFAFAAARFPRLAPALKMGIAYPLANRFRTGMTIAMFSLIIFSMTVFSILVANSNTLYTGNSARGGLDVFATTNRGNPVTDLKAALVAANSPAANEIAAVGRVTVTHELPEVKQSNQAKWQGFAVEAADDAFYAKVRPLMEDRAIGYADDAAILEALRTQPNVAVIDRNALLTDGNGAYAWHTDGVTVTNHQFEPFQVEFRDPASGKTGTLTVIGVLKSQVLSGLWTNAQTYAPVFGDPVYERHYLTLAPGAKADNVVKDIKGALVTQGVNAQSTTALLDEASAENTVFTRMFQGFMALGLLVGIAALGVIAFRSIVERRQQIGMLRAIGYQRGTVALSFLFEGSFIALMGVLSGVVGASVLARNLLTSDAFTQGQKVTFFIPWTEVSVFVVAAVAFSLLMTWWPSRGAAKIAIAEALRYE